MNMFSKITEAVSGFNWIEKRAERVVRKEGVDEVIGVRLRVTPSRAGAPQGAITVYESIMKKMNWVAGDYVRIGVDMDGGRLAIQRCISGGYALSANPKGNVSSQELKGKSVNCTVKFRTYDGHDFAKLVCKSMSIPAKKCSFETNTVIIDISDSL